MIVFYLPASYLCIPERFLLHFSLCTSVWMAERVGFEPTVHCCTHAFQACSLSLSDTSPVINKYSIQVVRGGERIRTSEGQNPCRFSRPVHSTALPRLQILNNTTLLVVGCGGSVFLGLDNFCHFFFRLCSNFRCIDFYRSNFFCYCFNFIFHSR